MERLTRFAEQMIPQQAPTPPSAVVQSLNDEQFQYSGAWKRSTGTGKHLQDDHYTDRSGDTYSVSFIGREVVLYASQAPHHGLFSVSVDGGAETRVDLYAPARADQVRVFSAGSLSDGTHTLRVRALGQKNPASLGYVVTADRVDVTSIETPAPVSRLALSISVKTAQGRAIAWAWVEIEDAKGQKLFAGNSATGNFQQPLPPGDYRVKAWSLGTFLGQQSVTLDQPRTLTFVQP